MKEPKTLFAGPWIGEFGWELFCWHGFLRKLSERYDHTIIACRTGHDLLYIDFATEIVHYDPEHDETDMWKNRREDMEQLRHLHRYYTAHLHTGVAVVHHDSYPTRWWTEEVWNKRQDFELFGRMMGDASEAAGYDVLMIVRDTVKCDTGFRNWPLESARLFAKAMMHVGLRVACVGKTGSAAHVDGTDDLRDMPLGALAQVMANSRVVVGPQCGPTHFATLCGLPQVCWQTCAEHAERVATSWNPFNIPVSTMASSDSRWKNRKLWLPPLESIVNATLRLMKGKTE